MSRRARAAAFAVAALACAALSAGLAGGYRSDIAAQLGPLRPVVVAREPLPADRVLTPDAVGRSLGVRRIPERFVPPGALALPADALGRAPTAPIPADAYVLGTQLRQPSPERAQRQPGLGAGGRPVEIAVTAAGALTARPPRGQRVDVVVTTEPGAGGDAGRTYVAAESVALLDLRGGGQGAPADALPGPPGETWVATLALSRPQALRLIQAESFARSVRLIGR
jgi:Flp pilus assembly protein CpaB